MSSKGKAKLSIILAIFELIVIVSCSKTLIRGHSDGIKSVNPLLNSTQNSIHVIYKKDGERELRLVFRGRAALETTAFIGTSYEIKYLRITDGVSLVQSVIQDGVYKDCQYSQYNHSVIEEFVRAIFQTSGQDVIEESVNDVLELYNAGEPGHVREASATFKGKKHIQSVKQLVMLNRAITHCRKYTRGVKKQLKLSKQGKMKRKHQWSLQAHVDNKDINDLPKYRLKHDYKKSAFNQITEMKPSFKGKIYRRRQMSKKTKKKHYNDNNTGLRQNNVIPSRSKRSYFNKFLMFPGTKWCGKGQIAKEYDELGEDQEADVCCRDHDCCPLIIYSFDYKYNYFNFRLHTILHCDCDQRYYIVLDI